jgi:hypothetical protein
MGNGQVKLKCTDPSCGREYGAVTWADWRQPGTLNKSFNGRCGGQRAPSRYSGNVVNIECATCGVVYGRVGSNMWSKSGDYDYPIGKCSHHSVPCTTIIN